MELISFSLYTFSTNFHALRNFLSGGSLLSLDHDRFYFLLSKIEDDLFLLKQEAQAEEIDSREPRYGLLNPLAFHLNETITKLKEAFESKNEEAFLSSGNQLIELCNLLHDQALELTVESAITAGKSKDPALNILMNAAQEDTLSEILIDYKVHFDGLSRGARQLIKSFQRFPAYRVELEALLDQYQAAQRALRGLEESLVRKKLGEIDSYLDLLRQFTDSYHELSAQIVKTYFSGTQESALEQPTKICPRCQNKNVEAAWTCTNCNFVFPQFEEDLKRFSINAKEGDFPEGTVVMTANLQTLFDAIEDYRDEEIDADELLKVIEWMEKKSALALTELENDLKEDKALFEAIGQPAKEGLLELQHGLALIRDWLSNQVDDDLIAAMKSCQDGTSKIYSSQIKAERLAEPS